jgi:hypothetical protein
MELKIDDQEEDYTLDQVLAYLDMTDFGEARDNLQRIKNNGYSGSGTLC